MHKALKTMLKEDIITPYTPIIRRTNSMSTYQQLTTEQIEVLILIDEINNCLKEDPDYIINGITEEIYERINPKQSESEICDALEYYGYIEYGIDEDGEETDYVLTIDGKQYIELFKEYLKAKTENPKVVYNYFTLINIKELNLKLIEKLEVLGVKIETSEIIKLANEVLESAKNIWSLLKKLFCKS